MLAEAMLLKGGVLNRLGKISDGTTTSDYDADEKETQKSLYSSLLHITWRGRDINIIDTPGSADFVGQVYGALSAAELALISVNASYGIEIGNRKAWDLARQQGCACMFVITRWMLKQTNLTKSWLRCKPLLAQNVLLSMIPIGSGRALLEWSISCTPLQCLIPAGYLWKKTRDSYGIGHLW